MTLSLTARQAAHAQETDQVFLLLLTISHVDLAEPIRVVNDAVDLVSRGQTFRAFPFQLPLPADLEEGPQSLSLLIDNVDREIVQAVRSLAIPPQVTIEVVLAASPDVVEVVLPDFALVHAGYDALVVSGTLTDEDDDLNEAYPGDTFTPPRFPAMF